MLSRVLAGCIFSAIVLAGCNGAGSALTGPPGDTERGEAGAINPARNVTVICEKDKNANNTAVTTNITNNCNKNNVNAVAEPPAPTIVEPKVVEVPKS